MFGRLGSPSEELPVPGLRRLVADPYVPIYEIAPDGVAVLAIRHGRQAGFDRAADADFDYEADEGE